MRFVRRKPFTWGSVSGRLESAAEDERRSSGGGTDGNRGRRPLFAGKDEVVRSYDSSGYHAARQRRRHGAFLPQRKNRDARQKSHCKAERGSPRLTVSQMNDRRTEDEGRPSEPDESDPGEDHTHAIRIVIAGEDADANRTNPECSTIADEVGVALPVPLDVLFGSPIRRDGEDNREGGKRDRYAWRHPSPSDTVRVPRLQGRAFVNGPPA